MTPRNPRCPDQDTPSAFQKCEVHALRMDVIEERIDRLEEEGTGRDHVLRGYDNDTGMIARLASVEKAFAEFQSHRKWLIGILVTALVGLIVNGIGLLPMLFK